eukprot:13953863-Alexandrium_andersonii.AAC.1
MSQHESAALRRRRQRGQPRPSGLVAAFDAAQVRRLVPVGDGVVVLDHAQHVRDLVRPRTGCR